MKRVALALAVVAVLFLGGWTYVAWQLHRAEVAWVEQLNQTVALGAKLADPVHSEFHPVPNIA